jgi:hypothetical protein
MASAEMPMVMAAATPAARSDFLSVMNFLLETNAARLA